MEALPASTRASNLSSATLLFMTESVVTHCLQRDTVSLPPWGLSLEGGKAVGWGQPHKHTGSRQDPLGAEGSSVEHPSC